jgi:hypothetical protein
MLERSIAAIAFVAIAFPGENWPPPVVDRF